MCTVRPSIRSLENTLSIKSEKSKWSHDFWDEALKISPCWDLNITTEKKHAFDVFKIKNIAEIDNRLNEHYYRTISTSAIDAKHEAIFGFTLYCLDILKELFLIQSGITGRLGLRTIAECYITLAYLIKKNDDQLWLSFRSYGSGQAKLAFLKIDELKDQPQFVSLDTLETLANEDQWQEFNDIELGHWEKSNLRNMSQFAEVKDVYNSFYDWTSGFSHGQWTSLRSEEFVICGNPLHRLHRIPKKHKNLPTVIPDAVNLCNKILESLQSVYPIDDCRLKLENK